MAGRGSFGGGYVAMSRRGSFGEQDVDVTLVMVGKDVNAATSGFN